MAGGFITVRRSSSTRRLRSGKVIKVPGSTFKVYRGKSYKVARGAKGPGARYGHEKKWITRKGKLGGPGYVHKPSTIRHGLLNTCVNKNGYRSCLGSIMALERNRTIESKYGTKLAADRHYLEAHEDARRLRHSSKRAGGGSQDSTNPHQYVLNPFTNRSIRVGGAVHNRLLSGTYLPML
jgi:hypothetical protein